MNDQKSKWLTKDLARMFSEGVRGAIPGATLQLEIITSKTKSMEKIFDCFFLDHILYIYTFTRVSPYATEAVCQGEPE